MRNSISKFDTKPAQIRINNKSAGLIVLLLLSSSILIAQKINDFGVKSPDGIICLYVKAEAKLQ